MIQSPSTVDLARMRVDIVGCFLRPATLKEAFDRHARGELDDAGLRAAQDAAIRTLIAQEEVVGLPIVNDGEFRRRQFMQSFSVVAGMEPWLQSVLEGEARRHHAEAPKALTQEHGNEVRRPVTRRLELQRNQVLDEYRFAASVATRPVKVTLIGPDRLSQRYAAEQSRDIYPGTNEFVADVVRVQQQMVGQLQEAGCRYVHIDEPGYTSYVDEQRLADMRSRGEDPTANMERSIRANNALVEAFPQLTFGVHLCRGNARSQWHRQGTYDASASFSSTMTSGPADSSRCGSCRRGRSRCSGSLRRSSRVWRPSMSCGVGSRRQLATCRSISSRSVRSAASPRRWRAIS
jgi:5-methyltetrahydropteroyltriglutamate--homocysteine methyltransferase